MMGRGARGAVVLVGAVVGVAVGCNQIAGIREGVPLEAEECAGALEGTPLAEQTAGDCVELVCDGAGRARVEVRESDTPDDGNVCTVDACVGSRAQHTPVAQAPCYSGAPGTEGIGVCKAGVQQCDGAGNPVGGCVGEVVPGLDCETAGGDEDCDGLADDGCECGDGVMSEWLGETCDDGGTDDGDNCSPTCQAQEVLQVVAGSWHSCAVLSQGTVKCWGDNDVGQLGLGDTVERGDSPGEMGNALPAVNLGKTALSLAAGYAHTCALLDDGSVKCWGFNSYGQLGLGDTAHRGDGPGEMGDALPAVNLGKTALSLDAGHEHTCALLDDGSVKCWGYNITGQLGLGDTAPRGDGPGELGNVLPSINLGRTALSVVAGYRHTCALLDNGSVKCWGWNAYGQLGLGDTAQRGGGPGEMGNALPAVNLGKTALSVVAGYGHTCALLDDGSVKCWGFNGFGQLGLGDTAPRGDEPGEMSNSLPAVNLGKTALSLAAHGVHTCALLDNGSVKCWGLNSYGQLGLGFTANRGDGPGEMGNSLPAINLGKTALSLAAGNWHTCALLDDGSVKCWGHNPFGQLGLGDTDWRGDDPGEMGDALPTVKLFSPFW